MSGILHHDTSLLRKASKNVPRVNTNFMCMETAVLNKAAILKAIRQHRQTLQQYGVQEIGLFGSFVRDEGGPDSDIDFLVHFATEKKTFDNLMGLSFFLEDFFHRKVELVTPEGLSPYIGPHILKTVEYVSLAN